MYTPLKITTDYSILKSMIKISNLISFCNDNKISACAIVDENLYGVFEFYESCTKNNIKPIIGLEISINNHKLYLYAINNNGYNNLLNIHNIKEKEALTIDILKEYSSDVLIIVPFDSIDEWENTTFFKERYIGYSNNQEYLNASIISSNIVYVVDLKVLNKDDLKYLKYLDKIRKDNVVSDDTLYYDDTVSNIGKINEIVEKCNVIFNYKSNYIPNYCDNSFDFLKKLVDKGLKKRLNNIVSDEYYKRAEYELSIINKMGFVDYFLIVYDYVLYAKKNNILVGPGRGSAAGSLISYAIGITEIDPLKYNLMFERFLNPERITMPDIDIDFDATKRDLVIEYVRNKYGLNCVALGITFNNLKSKLAIREIARILEIDNSLIDSFTKNIDASISLKDNLNNEAIKNYLKNYKELRLLYDIARKIENLKKNTSTHASGVIISNKDLNEIIPIHYENNILHTGVDLKYLENMGLLKMDFLGVKNITLIANILKNANINTLRNINLDNKNVYKIFTPDNIEGIFQFDTPSMQQLLSKLKPNCFDDLIAGVALNRPGPKMFLDLYVERKNNKKEITYIHPDLKPILKPTMGILIYQEQIIEILVKIAGYSMAEADIVRRAISKKNKDILKEEFVKFVSSAMKKGYSKDVAVKIYQMISPFASYGFNKSHSVAYALVAYQMAYLKFYYPSLFYLELIKDGIKSTEISKMIKDIKKLGIKIEKPNINNMILDYKITNNTLFIPCTLIKNLNKDIIMKINNVKINKFTDIYDFLFKTKEFMTASIFTTLIEAGLFDIFKINHKTLTENIETLLNYADLADGDSLISKPELIKYEEYDNMDLKNQELKSFGIFISNHPCSIYNSNDYTKLSCLDKKLFKNIKCAVIIDSVKSIKTKKGDDMAFLMCSDDEASAEFTIFPNNYESINTIKKGDLVIITGEVVKRYDKIQVVIKTIDR